MLRLLRLQRYNKFIISYSEGQENEIKSESCKSAAVRGISTDVLTHGSRSRRRSGKLTAMNEKL